MNAVAKRPSNFLPYWSTGSAVRRSNNMLTEMNIKDRSEEGQEEIRRQSCVKEIDKLINL